MDLIKFNTNNLLIGNINPFRYRGYYYDTETGFYYLQTRYYDPTICRFINADNYELVSTLSQTVGELNMYAYCNNNPIMYTDETGEGIWTFLMVVGISIVAGAIDGALTAQIVGQNPWNGLLAGVVGGFVGGVIGYFVPGAWGNVLGRGASSFIYDYFNEWLQTGTIDKNNIALYTVDIIMDMTFSMLYVEYFNSMPQSFGSILSGITDGTIDIAQTYLYFSPEAQSRIGGGSADNSVTKFYTVDYR